MTSIGRLGDDLTYDLTYDPYEDVPVLLRPFKPTALNITRVHGAPAMLTPHLYAGRLTVLQSEPEGGKSWWALAQCVELLSNGAGVIYLDEEEGVEGIEDRLRCLGVDQRDVDRGFRYFPFESRKWGADDLEALDSLIGMSPDVRLVVFDSLADMLSAAGLSEDKAGEVTSFVNSVCRPFREAGIAQLLLDHLVKPQQNGQRTRSRYSRGSGAKLAKADATLLIETDVPFDRANGGQLLIWRAKDKRGALTLPRIGAPGRRIIVDVEEGSVRLRESDEPPAAWDGPTEAMSQIVDVLVEQDELSQNQIEKLVPFSRRTVVGALSRLVGDARVQRRQGPRRSMLYRLADATTGEQDALDETF